MRRLFCLPMLLMLVFGSDVRAEPVPIATGVITFTDEPGLFEVSGEGFQLRFGWGPVRVGGGAWFDVCPVGGCAPESVVDWGTQSYVNSPFFDVAGSATIGDTIYPEIFVDVLATFTGPRVTLPGAGAGPEIVLLTAPFTFAGVVTAYSDSSRTNPSLFTLDLIGSGNAITVFIEQEGRFFSDIELEYRFAAAEPVPEPSTMLLLGTGLIGLLRRRRGGGAGLRGIDGTDQEPGRTHGLSEPS